MPRTNGSANGRPPAHPDPDRSSNAQATLEHAQARDGVLTGECREVTALRLSAALASPDLKPSSLEVAPGVTYAARKVTPNLARQVREAIEASKLDRYGVTNATAVMPWATEHLVADLTRYRLKHEAGRELTDEEAALASLKRSGAYGRTAYGLRYLEAVGLYAYRPGDGPHRAELAYSPAVLEEARSNLSRSSRRGGDSLPSHGGVTPYRVTRSRSFSVEKSPATTSSERERRSAQAPHGVTSTTERRTSRSVSTVVLDAYLDAITRRLEGTQALRMLEAEGWREDAGLRRALTRLAARAGDLDPSRVVTKLELHGERNLTGERWTAERVTERLAIAASNYGAEAVAAVTADDRKREAVAREAAELEAASREATERATPMPDWFRDRLRPRPSDAQATPEHATPTLEHAPAPLEVTPPVEVTYLEASAPPALDRDALEHAARTRRLDDREVADLQRLTLDAITAGLTAERTPAYLLDPPYRDRVLEHAVAPSSALDRPAALAAFAHLLDARRRHATPPPGDAVLAVLEQRLGRTLTLSELDLLDVLPVSVSVSDLDAWANAASGDDPTPALAASTGRP
jgi:hypothetical protein